MSESVRVGTPRKGLILAILCVTSLIISIDTTIVNVALPRIAEQLRTTSGELELIVAIFGVVFGGLLLTFGAVGDAIGRLTVYAIGLAIFAAGSVVSAFAHTSGLLIVGRAGMGLGAAAVLPSTLSILANVFTGDRERARAIGVWSGTTGLGIALGPIAGGLLLVHFWWGSVFLVNVPIAIASLLMSLLFVPNSHSERPRRPDVVGGLLSTLGIALLIWSIVEVPGRGWSDALVAWPLALGIACVISFVAWERHVESPLLALAVLRQTRVRSGLAALALILFGLLGLFFVLTQYLQFFLGYSPLRAGAALLPVAAVVLVVAPLSVLWAERSGSRVVILCGTSLIVLSLLALSRTSIHSTYLDGLPAFLGIGIGAGLALAPSTEAVVGGFPRAESGVGSATGETAMQVGGAFGIGALGSVLYSSYLHSMRGPVEQSRLPPHVQQLLLKSFGESVQVSQHLPAAVGRGIVDASRQGFVTGMDAAVILGACIVGVGGVVLALILPAPDRQRVAAPEREVATTSS